MDIIKKYREIFDRNKRVLNVVHKDMDGVGCSIVTSKIYKNIRHVSLKYGEVDSYLKRLDFSDYDMVLLTDISPETKEVFELSDKIFIIDHHESAMQFADVENGKIILKRNSATKLCKEFFENLFNVDLSYLNEFVEKIDLYDCWKHSLYDLSWALNELYFYYYEDDFRNRFKNGNMKFSEDELNYISGRKKLLNEIYNNLNVYECERVNMCFFVENRFVNDICHKLMNEEGFDISICINSKSKTCSVRTKRDDINIGEVLKTLFGGGGHKAAGAFRHDPNEEISIKIEQLESYLYKNFKEIRK